MRPPAACPAARPASAWESALGVDRGVDGGRGGDGVSRCGKSACITRFDAMPWPGHTASRVHREHYNKAQALAEHHQTLVPLPPAPCTKRGTGRGVSMPSAAPLGAQLRLTGDAQLEGPAGGSKAQHHVVAQSPRSRTRRPFQRLRCCPQVLQRCWSCLHTRSALRALGASGAALKVPLQATASPALLTTDQRLALKRRLRNAGLHPAPCMPHLAAAGGRRARTSPRAHLRTDLWPVPLSQLKGCTKSN